ncbi:MAG: hypothetical protein PHF37_03120 [Phycisphaerae bacterium]|jgi:hypothetical protein|nr:hypothetical protein [Phycisphaerae bacterium]
MNKSETFDWIKTEICGRWPGVELTQAIKDDLYNGLLSVGQEYATQAAQQQRADSQAKYPNAARIVKIARDLQKKFGPSMSKQRSFTDFHCSCVYLGGLESVNWKAGKVLSVRTRLCGAREMPEAFSDVIERCRYWLGEGYGDATKFQIFIDDHSAAEASGWNLRMLDPAEREHYADYLDALEASKKKRLAVTVASGLPEIPKEAVVNTAAKAREMITAVKVAEKPV